MQASDGVFKAVPSGAAANSAQGNPNGASGSAARGGLLARGGGLQAPADAHAAADTALSLRQARQRLEEARGELDSERAAHLQTQQYAARAQILARAPQHAEQSAIRSSRQRGGPHACTGGLSGPTLCGAEGAARCTGAPRVHGVDCGCWPSPASAAAWAPAPEGSRLIAVRVIAAGSPAVNSACMHAHTEVHTACRLRLSTLRAAVMHV